ncbi:hypothetical protein DAPPUDRAFT_268750 [Daphnia pulex]|uniref:Peptidase S1 domain-containing protein n=1 Tax=Daphnia pulex TaxID=6669 RepID=E9HYB4_DAPPU|nr:hypothetical protein DAPPUDRAFT_268750 [Daphnia pulex]|eukprot:EFX63263.1 hypothetical protein DAPPUDRAFT_268750 [Daphnia pulex]
MKSALILLSVLIVLSNQKMRQSSRDMMYWLSHHYLPHPAFNNYNNYQTITMTSIKVILRSYVASHPKDPWTVSIGHCLANAQSRIKGFNRHRPLLFPAKSPKDPRVVINLASQSNFFTRRVKTITFTMTSSVTIITSVQSCIPSADFFTGATDRTCRRKRRGIVEARGFRSEESQFAIAPSEGRAYDSFVTGGSDNDRKEFRPLDKR